MTDAIEQRGPDDHGYWIDADAGIALGHRRLAIIDLSAAGHQPMISHDERLVIVFNGEIYNFSDLRRQLEAEGHAPDWRGHSDTEVLLGAICAWGIDEALKRSIGMFAFALWDRKDRRLTLARDRMGEKPLYFGWQGGGANRAFVFGSELSALQRHPSVSRSIDRQALNLLLRHNYVPAPFSIFSDIRKLPPGSFATIEFGAESVVMCPYWDFLSLAGSDLPRFKGTADQAVDQLEMTLSKAVSRQMVSDVPIGAFLSGGVDSSTVVALMQQQANRPVRTFTIGFDVPGYNEAAYARQVAGHLGTDHTELYVQPDDALEVIPMLADIYAEPFADSSQIPTYLVSRLARQHVTVALSGDAGDELFGGYERYRYVSKYGTALLACPSIVRRTGRFALNVVPPSLWNYVKPGLGRRVAKVADVLKRDSIDDVYLELISHFSDPKKIVPTSEQCDPFTSHNLEKVADLPPVERMMAADSVHYLPDDILVKVDRAAMACSLETRVPLLDPDVISAAWQMPLGYKIRDGQTKWLLRQILYRHVPRSLIERPKMGFGVPIAPWLRGPLRGWAGDLLSPERLKRNDHFDSKAVSDLWEAHLSGREDNAYRLWTILMFEAWLDRFG